MVMARVGERTETTLSLEHAAVWSLWVGAALQAGLVFRASRAQFARVLVMAASFCTRLGVFGPAVHSGSGIV